MLNFFSPLLIQYNSAPYVYYNAMFSHVVYKQMGLMVQKTLCPTTFTIFIL